MTIVSGLYNSQRSLLINQAAISVVNNNIANMNTVGYSKQRVELSQHIVDENAVNSTISMANNLGGVNIDDITRNRDLYLDDYYRKENTNLSFYDELHSNAVLIEDMSNELSGSGILNSLNEFYNAAQDLSLNPTDSVTRANYLSRAEDVALKFNQTYSQLEELRENLVGDPDKPYTLNGSKINNYSEDLNLKLSQLAELNNSVAISSSQGNTPSSLLDKRDLLLDEIAEYVPINISYENNNIVNVSLGSVELVAANKQIGFVNATLSSPADDNNPVIMKIQDKDDNDMVSDANSLITSGKIGALLQVGGSDSNELTIKGVLDNLNTIAVEFATEINNIQTYSDAGNDEYAKYIDSSTNQLALSTSHIFVEDSSSDTATYANLTAGNITINSNIVNDTFKIATARTTLADVDGVGNGNNALLTAQQRDSNIAGLNNSTVEKFLSSKMGELGIKTENIKDKFETQTYITQEVEMKKEASMGVNLDEELTDLVKFQRAYEASAKIFNVISSILEQTINLGR